MPQQSYIPQSVAVAEARKVEPNARPKQKDGRYYFLKGPSRIILGSGSTWLEALVDLERRAVEAWMRENKLEIKSTAEAKLILVFAAPVLEEPPTYDVVSPEFDNFRVLCLWWRERRENKNPILATGRIVLTPVVPQSTPRIISP